MNHPPAWGPRLDAPPGALLRVQPFSEGVAAWLALVRKLGASLRVPVQAIRSDRVLSRTHLIMAWTHAQRRQERPETRVRDAGVAFLQMASLEPQIDRAIAALGVTDATLEAGDTLVVVLGAVDRARIDAAFLEIGIAGTLLRWEDDARDWFGPQVVARADAYWTKRARSGTPSTEADGAGALEAWLVSAQCVQASTPR